MSNLLGVTSAGSGRPNRGRRADLIDQLVAYLLPFVYRVIRPQLEKELLSLQPVDPADVRALARLAGALAIIEGGGFGQVRQAMRGIYDLAKLDTRPGSPQALEEAVRIATADETRGLAEAWIAAIERIAPDEEVPVVDCRRLDGSMLPPDDQLTAGCDGREPMDAAAVRGILWDVRHTLYEGRTLPDCAVNLLVFDGYAVTNF